MKHPELAEKVARECWQRIWFEDADATEPDSLRAAFGAPFIVAHVNGKKEIFFGSDRFPVLAMVIGNQPPATNPNKAAYMMADWPRLAKYFDVQLKQPANFWEVIVKRGTLIPQRFITAVDMKHPELAEKVARECWQRIWFEDVDATEPDSLRAAAEKAGLSKDVIDDALARMTAPEVKDRLRAYTQEALDLGEKSGRDHGQVRLQDFERQG
nr:hypothetical protein BaRGS_032866 [Batillaria attramentaria]